MALSSKAQAALALHRFGLGPRAGSIAAIASDPRGALNAELDRPGAGRIVDPDLRDSGAASRAVGYFLQAQRDLRQKANDGNAERESTESCAGAGHGKAAAAASAGCR